MPDISLAVANWAARDDVVFIEYEISGSVAGRPLSWTGIGRFKLRGERAIDAIGRWDNLDLLAQLDPTVRRTPSTSLKDCPRSHRHNPSANAKALRNGSQRRSDVLRIEADLGRREAQRGQSRDGVGLITPPVLRLLGRRPVVAQPVGLDHQAELRPVEVNAKAIQLDLGQRRRQAGASGKRQEKTLESGVGQGEGLSVEQVAQMTAAGPARAPLDRCPQILRVDQVESVSLVDGELELIPADAGGEVDQRPDRIGDGDPIHDGVTRRVEPLLPMDADGRPSAADRAGDDHIDLG
jgi:hypothetical protein